MDSLTPGLEGTCEALRRAALLLPDRLLWLPEKGTGFYPVRAAPYDDDYFEKYVGYAATPMGKALNEARSALVIRHVGHQRPLDFGIGCGSWIEHHGGWGFDIMPKAKLWLIERNMFVSPYTSGPPQGVLTCWDSLEHVREPEVLLATIQSWLFVSLPIFAGGEHALRSKHFRKDEHFWYWTRQGFIGWLDEQGFEVVEHSTVESDLGREDIETFAARRR